MGFFEGLSLPEAPVALGDGSWLITEMGPGRGSVTRIVSGHRQELARTGRPNGLAVAQNDIIWVAETQPPALLRMSDDGQYAIFAESCGTDNFRFPNDLCFGPDGMLYLTDSGISVDDWQPGGTVRDDYYTAPIDGRVFRVDPTGSEIVELDRRLRFANGIAFGPGDQHLYVSETVTGNIIRYAWTPNGLGPADVFGNVIDPTAPAGLKGPDGMAFGKNGDLYVAVFGQGDVTVLAPDGHVRHRIPTPGAKPTNVAFGIPGDDHLYVTEDDSGVLEVFDVHTDGLALHAGLRGCS